MTRVSPAWINCIISRNRATDALNRSKSLLHDPELFSFEEDATLESSRMEVYGDSQVTEIADK